MRYVSTLSLLATVAATAALAGHVSAAEAQKPRPARVDGHPNLNGIWQAMNSAYWNLEAHSATAIRNEWKLGALSGIPAGESVVEGGTIPYLPKALKTRDENRAGYPASDPVTKCYMPGIPRANYQPYPFEIIQGDGNILFDYSFATANRVIHMKKDEQLAYDDIPVDQWMGWSNGHWDGDTLVVEVLANDDRTWFDRAGNYHSSAMKVTEHYSLIDDSHMRYEATIDDPDTFSRPWKISMQLYRRTEPNVELFGYKCVEFAEPLLYGKYLKKPIE